ncbi:MAG: hypothetical protein JWN63_2304 [Candidatus Acidoferrum typicum]|nr:hypothetical protein [Candidatus Acidoferrum typicum]
MTQTATKQQPEAASPPITGEISLPEMPLEDSREWQAEQLRLLWGRRRFFLRATAIGLLVSTLLAFLIPKQYKSTTQLMPPDTQSTSGMAMMAAMAAKAGGGLAGVAGDLLGLKSSGSLFIGVLRSETSQDRLIEQFDLREVYGTRLVIDARTKLNENTSISEDKKSGIITISVTDHNPKRAASLASAYVGQLNSLVSELSTSSAHRERVFLEERLKMVKQNLDDASNQLAQFSSKNNTLDIQQEGKAMLDVAANLAGQMIAAQAQLEGVRRIYTDNNPRVQSLNARVGELRKQLEKLSGVNGKPGESPETFHSSLGDLPYPSIRNLPLLGVKYADYYRHAKIQETVFELLTEQYELAKVQEAKETPSVKVLDPAQVPEKKSFPPRLLIMCLGTFLLFSMSAVWVLGAEQWRAANPDDPRKILAKEVVETLKARAHWLSRNGSGPARRKTRI